MARNTAAAKPAHLTLDKQNLVVISKEAHAQLALVPDLCMWLTHEQTRDEPVSRTSVLSLAKKRCGFNNDLRQENQQVRLLARLDLIFTRRMLREVEEQLTRRGITTYIDRQRQGLARKIVEGILKTSIDPKALRSGEVINRIPG